VHLAAPCRSVPVTSTLDLSMSFTVDLIVGPLPTRDKDAWKTIKRLRETYYEDKREKAPALLRLHGVLTAKYPCLSSYALNDPAEEDCPWADGPMLGNFAHDMGMLAISFRRADELLPFIVEAANALGITVADGQSERIYRPKSGGPDSTSKPWWAVWR